MDKTLSDPVSSAWWKHVFALVMDSLWCNHIVPKISRNASLPGSSNNTREHRLSQRSTCESVACSNGLPPLQVQRRARWSAQHGIGVSPFPKRETATTAFSHNRCFPNTRRTIVVLPSRVPQRTAPHLCPLRLSMDLPKPARWLGISRPAINPAVTPLLTTTSKPPWSVPTIPKLRSGLRYYCEFLLTPAPLRNQTKLCVKTSWHPSQALSLA